MINDNMVQMEGQDAAQTIPSPYRGLTYDRKTLAFRVRIFYGAKQRHIGRFKDPVVAAKAYDKSAYYLYGNRAVLNFSIEEARNDTTSEVPASIKQAKAEAHAMRGSGASRCRRMQGQHRCCCGSAAAMGGAPQACQAMLPGVHMCTRAAVPGSGAQSPAAAASSPSTSSMLPPQSPPRHASMRVLPMHPGGSSAGRGTTAAGPATAALLQQMQQHSLHCSSLLHSPAAAAAVESPSSSYQLLPGFCSPSTLAGSSSSSTMVMLADGKTVSMPQVGLPYAGSSSSSSASNSAVLLPAFTQSSTASVWLGDAQPLGQACSSSSGGDGVSSDCVMINTMQGICLDGLQQYQPQQVLAPSACELLASTPPSPLQQQQQQHERQELWDLLQQLQQKQEPLPMPPGLLQPAAVPCMDNPGTPQQLNLPVMTWGSRTSSNVSTGGCTGSSSSNVLQVVSAPQLLLPLTPQGQQQQQDWTGWQEAVTSGSMAAFSSSDGGWVCPTSSSLAGTQVFVPASLSTLHIG